MTKLLCSTVCQHGGHHNVHKRWTGLQHSWFPQERRAAGLKCVHSCLYPGNSSCHQGAKWKSNFVLPRKGFSVNDSWTRMLMSLLTGRHLHISADGRLHCCAVGCLPGFLWNCSCLLDFWWDPLKVQIKFGVVFYYLRAYQSFFRKVLANCLWW